MQNISTYMHGKKLFISIDLSKDSGKTQSGKSLNVASSQGYCPLPIAPGHRLKLHLYRLAKHSAGNGKNQTPVNTQDASDQDINQILALASGLPNETRKTLIEHLKQMIVRDSVN
jgi:hypothetical protein